MADHDTPSPKTAEKDIGQIVRYLTATFNQATSTLDRPHRPKGQRANQLYYMQTDFAYLLNEVMQGPRCVLQKNIAACNEFIDQVMQHQAVDQ